MKTWSGYVNLNEAARWTLTREDKAKPLFFSINKYIFKNQQHSSNRVKALK